MENNKHIVQVAAECLDILLAISRPEFRRLTVAEIAVETELNKSKVYRLLRTLESRQLVRRKNEEWEVSPETVKIADGFRRHIARKRAELEAQHQEYLGE